jgi:ketosteroid isomerase-like protein
MGSRQPEITTLLDERGQAAWDKDTDRLMAVFSDDIVYFDIVPPLHYTGSDALRARFADWFLRWRSPIGQEISDLEVVAGGEVAAAHMLVRASGTLVTGQEVDYWVRVTDVFRHSGDGWLITHEHVSVPVDLASRTAVMDLVP